MPFYGKLEVQIRGHPEGHDKAARGFLQPCHAISEKAREIAVEGKNVLKILSPDFKRRYRFLFG